MGVALVVAAALLMIVRRPGSTFIPPNAQTAEDSETTPAQSDGHTAQGASRAEAPSQMGAAAAAVVPPASAPTPSLAPTEVATTARTADPSAGASADDDASDAPKLSAEEQSLADAVGDTRRAAPSAQATSGNTTD